MDIVKWQVDTAVSALRTNILRYYDALHELRRMSLLLLRETATSPADIESWFASENFGVCEDGFWQSLSALEKHRQGTLSEDAVSYSCHPDLRFDRKACFRMYAHRNIGKHLSEIRSRLPGAAWVYYQDASNMSLQHPFIDPAGAIPPDFDWSTYHTWVSVAPENNPDRSIRWTDPSIDYAGEGLILSVSIPVYAGDEFLGLWSIDLSMEALYRNCIQEKQMPEQQNFICDEGGAVVVHPVIKTRIDKEKGSIYRENLRSLGGDFGGVDLPELFSNRAGQMELTLDGHRVHHVLYKAVPEINWIYFSIFPKDRIIDVVNSRIRSALDKVRSGDYGRACSGGAPASAAAELSVDGLNEMIAALEAQHDQLQESQKRIIQSEKLSAVGTLAGGIAHDFNNILSTIIGFTELSLDDAEEGTPMAENLRQVHAAGLRAKELVRQILTFARQDEEDLKPIRLDGIVKEALKLLRSSIPTTIAVRSRVESRSRIMGSAINIHQVLINLCTNAAHAMEDGGVIDVALEDVDAGEVDILRDRAPFSERHVRLTVSDTGTGIPPHIRDLIFEPYFTTKPIGRGTGMGLSVVHGIVKKYDGEITVESEVGRGTAFSIFFPVTENKAETPVHESEAKPEGVEHILFVDDEPAIAEMGGKMLRRLGYRVTARTSSTDALELFERRKKEFDLVVTDMTMPDMAGDRLARELMKIREDIPIILCTGYSDRISSEEAERIGIRAFAYKPIATVDLAKTVRKVLDETSRNRPPAP